MCLVTALVGLVGTMLNSRPILAIYNLLLWPTLAAILVVGYTSYRKQALNLDRKLNQAWSQFFDDAARLRLQNSVSWIVKLSSKTWKPLLTWLFPGNLLLRWVSCIAAGTTVHCVSRLLLVSVFHRVYDV